MKNILLSIIIILCIIFSSCREQAYNKVTFKDGHSYLVCVYTDDNSFTIDGIELSTATIDQIRNIKFTSIISEKYDAYIETPEQAVEFGAEILNSQYDTWTYENYIGVVYNNVANVWIVHGQTKDRNTNQDVGYAIIDAKNMEIICVGQG